MLDILVGNRIWIDIVILRRNVVARIVSRHGCIDLSKGAMMGMILMVDGDGRLAEVGSTSFKILGCRGSR